MRSRLPCVQGRHKAPRSCRSRIPYKPLNRSVAGVLAAAFAPALAGCGGYVRGLLDLERRAIRDDEQPNYGDGDRGRDHRDSSSAHGRGAAGDGDNHLAQDEPGGAGDEEPARSLALFTGEGGRITPRLVRVPPFISIRVELRSADGREYGLTFAGETIRVSSGLGSVSTTIDGLRPNMGVIGIPTGASNRVRIAATAEPGP